MLSDKLDVFPESLPASESLRARAMVALKYDARIEIDYADGALIVRARKTSDPREQETAMRALLDVLVALQEGAIGHSASSGTDGVSHRGAGYGGAVVDWDSSAPADRMRR